MNACTRRATGLTFALAALSGAALACTGDIPPQNPNDIYVLHDDGTATDTRTGLMWKRCSEGQTLTASNCTGAAGQFTWSAALAAAQASTYAGYTDWRLPSVKELGSLVETCRANPSINTHVFPNTPLTPNPSFWTASPAAGADGSAWFMGFDLGYALRSLRGGQTKARLVRDAE
jgi:hypothetical protein